VSKRLAGVAFAVAIAMVGLPRLVQAQGLTGHISGTVTDTTGGVLPGVTVTIRNVGTGLTRETVTGTDGAFVFPTNATFDYTTGALTNANTLGRITGATLSARRIQLGARFTF
jgi:hypothetical protein